jgi:hypothetical protein
MVSVFTGAKFINNDFLKRNKKALPTGRAQDIYTEKFILQMLQQ